METCYLHGETPRHLCQACLHWMDVDRDLEAIEEMEAEF